MMARSAGGGYVATAGIGSRRWKFLFLESNTKGNLLKVNPIGARVTIGYESSPIEAIVTQINISTHGVRYEVTWWDGRCRYESWITADEITQNSRRKQEVGFHNAGRKDRHDDD